MPEPQIHRNSDYPQEHDSDNNIDKTNTNHSQDTEEENRNKIFQTIAYKPTKIWMTM